jgi:hypothetical protein
MYVSRQCEVASCFFTRQRGYLFKLFALELAGKKQSRADSPFIDVCISYQIFPNALFEREICSTVFLA